MTRIAISATPTGTGTFTLEAPVSNNNRTFTLPDASGTLFVGSLATQAGAEAGTNNTTVMTPLRTKQAITAQVLSVTAGASVGAVGTYAWLAEVGAAVNHLPGATRAGSNLRFAGEWGSFSGGNTGGQLVSSPVPSGTWRCMGYSVGTSFQGATLWLRIS